MTTNVQVYPSGERWGVKVVGDQETAPLDFATRDEAIQEGRRMAEERGGDLLIHDETGELEAKAMPEDSAPS